MLGTYCVHVVLKGGIWGRLWTDLLLWFKGELTVDVIGENNYSSIITSRCLF